MKFRAIKKFNINIHLDIISPRNNYLNLKKKLVLLKSCGDYLVDTRLLYKLIEVEKLKLFNTKVL